ncbi:tetratricopeptide repeat protein [Fulvivirga lutea]|uniref:Tetratricopeptide repeat protein n=1 Tax=Fulvivirga lutea TaxID=2810512 RepID=A0A975A0G7_9BACT|nr:tetratricopeptide repeat protein [Fulvivirga lutea]QSE96402.1 tetratricopeptide repeat protein [Fulvivirga lutea]
MKRLIVFMLAIMVVGYSYGQKKPKINQAEKARTEGNLGEAKNIIDEAIVHEKTKDDEKTWYYRGLIYASLDTTQNPTYQNLANDPLKTAMESFKKADEMNAGNNEFYITGPNGFPVTKGEQISTLWGHYLNKGVEYYNVQDYKGAYKYFMKTTMVQPEDTTGYIYSASVAQADKEYDKALKNYYVLTNDLDYHSKDIYSAIIYIEGVINEDNEKALEMIRAAKAQFPSDMDFAKSEINALIKLERIDEAQKELEAAIASEPDNANLRFTLGVMYEEIGDPAKAKEAYRGAIEVDPEYYNARFNLAVLSYNQAVDLIKEKNNLGISQADQKKAKAMQLEIEKRLKESLPHWEKLNALQANDRTTLETLQYIYTQLKMYDKAEKVSNQLEALGDE